MAYASIPYTAPSIPLVPGVPSLAAVATGLGAGPALAIADQLGLGALFGGLSWGIFDDGGNPVLTGDCVAEVGYRSESRISDYPVEQGGFASYNKVQLPIVGLVSFMVGGADRDRAAFLKTAQGLQTSLDLYSIVMPEITYPSVNVTGINYRRTSRQGATLLRVEVMFEEVRVTAQATFTNTATPSGASPVNSGTVAPTTPPQSVLTGAQGAS